MIRHFCASDRHSTFVGKSGCFATIRRFIYYLEEHHLVNNQNLHLCIDAGTAPSEKIVDILTDEQVQLIERFSVLAKSPIELRDAAMVLVALKMGFRASDVINLCFENIDWEEQTITILQSKTKISLTLPMPTSVGNAIYFYIKYGRPAGYNNYVFIRHRAPYGRLTNKLCTNALLRIIPDRRNVNQGGFHVTRRTFATSLLRKGYGSNRVMDALGHTILYTLNQEKYLRRYLEDGHLSIDNNDCERSIKNFAVGRRNWLFAKSIKGAEASAAVYSITETAVLHGLRPCNYLAYVMEKISQAPPFGASSYLDDFLPWSPTLPNNLKSNIIRK